MIYIFERKKKKKNRKRRWRAPQGSSVMTSRLKGTGGSDSLDHGYENDLESRNVYYSYYDIRSYGDDFSCDFKS